MTGYAHPRGTPGNEIDRRIAEIVRRDTTLPTLAVRCVCGWEHVAEVAAAVAAQLEHRRTAHPRPLGRPKLPRAEMVAASRARGAEASRRLHAERLAGLAAVPEPTEEVSNPLDYKVGYDEGKRSANVRVAALEAALRDCASTAGHPDAAEGCRLIIGIVRDASLPDGAA